MNLEPFRVKWEPIGVRPEDVPGAIREDGRAPGRVLQSHGLSFGYEGDNRRWVTRTWSTVYDYDDESEDE